MKFTHAGALYDKFFYFLLLKMGKKHSLSSFHRVFEVRT